MQAHIIKAVQDAGFSVYMRFPSDTYLYFTDGQRIGTLQADRLGYCKISTVHIPNTTTGTGFALDEIPDLSRATLEKALAEAPSWATSRDRQSVQKWKSWEHFQKASNWNATFQLVSE